MSGNKRSLTLTDFIVMAAHHPRRANTHEGADEVLAGHAPGVAVVEPLGTLIQV